MIDKNDMKRITEASVIATGFRYCRACNKDRRPEGGKIMSRGANGAKQWRCAACVNKTNPGGFK